MSASFGECPSGGDGFVEPFDRQHRVAGGRSSAAEGEGALSVVSTRAGAVPDGVGPRLAADGEGGAPGDVEIEIDGVGVEREVELGAGGVDTGRGDGDLDLPGR
jgi:hypothetical protein